MKRKQIFIFNLIFLKKQDVDNFKSNLITFVLLNNKKKILLIYFSPVIFF